MSPTNGSRIGASAGGSGNSSCRSTGIRAVSTGTISGALTGQPSRPHVLVSEWITLAARTAGRHDRQIGRCAVLDEPQDGVGVEMAFYQITERVDPRRAQRRERDVRRRGEVPAGRAGNVGEEGPPEAVVLQDAVPTGPPDGAPAASVEERLRRAVDRRDPMVDLV